MRSRMRLSPLVIAALHAAFDVFVRRINRWFECDNAAAPSRDWWIYTTSF